jgi:MFS family permease
MEYWQTVKQLNFAKLWLAQILSQVAQNLLNFALIILVYDLSVGSRFGSFSVSLVVLAFTIPSILFAPVAGIYVDYWDRKRVLLITNLLRAILVTLYIPFSDHLWLTLLLTFLTSTVTQFFVPAEASTIPKVVPEKLLLPANSLFIFSMYAAFVVGFSASGPVVRIFGSEGPFVATAIMFAIATVLVALLPPLPRKKEADHLPKLHIIRELRRNKQVIMENRDRAFSVMQLAVTQGIVFVLITLAPALSLALLGVSLQEASHVIIIPVGLGMVLGVLLVNAITKNRSKVGLIQFCLIAASVILIMIGLTGQLHRNIHGEAIATTADIAVIVGALMLILGIINAMVSAAAQTLLQESTEDKDRGKVFGSLNLMVNIAATLPVFITGLLADLLSVTKVVMLIGGTLFVYSLFMLWRYGYRRELGRPVEADVLMKPEDTNVKV